MVQRDLAVDDRGRRAVAGDAGDAGERIDHRSHGVDRRGEHRHVVGRRRQREHRRRRSMLTAALPTRCCPRCRSPSRRPAGSGRQSSPLIGGTRRHARAGVGAREVDGDRPVVPPVRVRRGRDAGGDRPAARDRCGSARSSRSPCCPRCRSPSRRSTARRPRRRPDPGTAGDARPRVGAREVDRHRTAVPAARVRRGVTAAVIVGAPRSIWMAAVTAVAVLPALSVAVPVMGGVAPSAETV